jgi:hypothetical protein
MPDAFAELRREVAVANRVLANEGIIDAFGHISARHPKDPNRYFISRHRASELVEPSDVLEMTLDSKPVHPTPVRLYSEMVIHGEIYKARPDVNSVCHHHAPSVLPFCATGVELVPLFHLGGTLGTKVPFWDSRDEFGDTNLLVRTPEEGASHARARLALHAAAAPARRVAGRQDRARMRVPLHLHHAQRRAAAARDGDRHPGAAVARRGGEMRRAQSRLARGRARLGILGDAAAEGRGDVGGGRPAAHEGIGRGGAAADRGAAHHQAHEQARREEARPEDDRGKEKKCE